jgi:putative sterol carrier protein
MADIDLSNFASLEPKEFAQIVKSASNAQLNEALKGDVRAQVLGGIFAAMPGSFRADRAGSTNAVIHWTLSDGPDGPETYELIIADGTCVLSPSATQEPKLALTLATADFLKIVTGSGNAVMLFMTGKVKAKGDLGLAAKIADLFDVPKA